MTDQDNSYRPRSPDFSGFPGAFQPPDPYHQTPYPLTSPIAHRASYDASPFFTPQFSPTSQNPSPQYFDSHAAEMARRTRSQALAEAQEWQQQQPPPPQLQQPQIPQIPQQLQPHPYPEPELPPQQSLQQKDLRIETATEPSSTLPAIEVKTKFPVARIKRIMQADEDVGKVAQVTPIAVSKALELFMISLVTKASQEARDRSSKRVAAVHLKRAVAKDEVLDFLADIIAKVPDQSAKKEDDGSDQNEGKKRKGSGRRKKEDSDDF